MILGLGPQPETGLRGGREGGGEKSGASHQPITSPPIPSWVAMDLPLGSWTGHLAALVV